MPTRFQEILQKHFQQRVNKEHGKLAEWQRKRFEVFLDNGLPTRKDEEWKYTSAAAIVKNGFEPLVDAGQNDETIIPKEYLLGLSDAWRMVFLNGFYAKKQSDLRQLSTGLQIESLSDLRKNQPEKLAHRLGMGTPDEAFTLLNDAFLQDGAFIHIAENCRINKPLHLLSLNQNLSDAILVQPRHVVQIGKNSLITIVLSAANFNTDKGELNNLLTQITVEENAELHLYLVHDQENSDTYLDHTYIEAAKNSRVFCYNLTLGGKLIRNDLRVNLIGEGSEANLFGLYALHGKQHADNRTLVIHAKPHCQSNELYKGILDEQSTGIFNGKILVEQDAQKTLAFQHNPNILLSNEATINSKPQLEIFADDVKCTHGASSGGIDPNALYYLQTRGIGLNEARKLLVYAFSKEVSDAIALPALKDWFEQKLSERFLVS